MKSLLAILPALALISGCASGEAYRTTTVTPTGDKTVYEAKRTGLWFATGIKPLVTNGDGLELGKTD